MPDPPGTVSGPLECAIILAAGKNRRMGSIKLPKALLPLNPSSLHAASGEQPNQTVSFLSRHIELLEQRGVEKIVVVTSTRHRSAFAPWASARVDVVASRFSHLPVGSSLSLLSGLEAALAWRPGGARTLIMDADIVYEAALLDAVSSACDRSRLFAIDRVAGDREEVRVYGRSPSEPVLIGKGLPATLTSDLMLLGESLGLIYLAPPEREYCADLIRWLAGEPPHRQGFGFSGAMSEHEEVWQYLFCLRRLAIGRLPGSLLYSECDSPEDYAHIQATMFPAILERDQMAARGD